jgi:hypothetical protein
VPESPSTPVSVVTVPEPRLKACLPGKQENSALGLAVTYIRLQSSEDIGARVEITIEKRFSRLLKKLGMLRVPQHDRKIINDFKFSPFVPSVNSG